LSYKCRNTLFRLYVLEIIATWKFPHSLQVPRWAQDTVTEINERDLRQTGNSCCHENEI